MSLSGSGKKKKGRTKVNFWLDNSVVELIDQVAKSYGISRSDYLRLILRGNLASQGLLPHRTGNLLPTEGDTKEN